MCRIDFPVWVCYAQALGPAAVALVVGIFAFWLGYQQWRTAHNKLRFDLFERRLKVYLATQSVIRTISLTGQLTRDDLDEFSMAVEGAHWLFDERLKNRYQRIQEFAWKAFMARASGQKSDSHPLRPQLIKEEEEYLEFIKQQGPTLDRDFGPYLDFSKVRVV